MTVVFHAAGRVEPNKGRGLGKEGVPESHSVGSIEPLKKSSPLRNTLNEGTYEYILTGMK